MHPPKLVPSDRIDLVSRPRGDLVIGTDIFAVTERERLRARFLTLLAWLAERSHRQADYAAAQEHALRLLSHDACREDAHGW